LLPRSVTGRRQGSGARPFLATALWVSLWVNGQRASKYLRFNADFKQLAEAPSASAANVSCAANYPVSRLQLFVAGPRDKLITVVIVGAAGRGPRVAADLAALPGEPGFAGKTSATPPQPKPRHRPGLG
jgi:hypothetical protein